MTNSVLTTAATTTVLILKGTKCIKEPGKSNTKTSLTSTKRAKQQSICNGQRRMNVHCYWSDFDSIIVMAVQTENLCKLEIAQYTCKISRLCNTLALSRDCIVVRLHLSAFVCVCLRASAYVRVHLLAFHRTQEKLG